MEKRKKRLWGYHQAVMVYEIMLWLLTTAAVISTGILFIPKLAGVRPYVILSSSMEPAIRTGSLIFVNTRDRKADQGYITKGDHNDTVDPALLTKERMIGTCIGALPGAGYAAAALRGKGTAWAAAALFGMHVFGIMLDMPEIQKD